MVERIKKAETSDGATVEVWIDGDVAHVTAAYGVGWTARHVDMLPSEALMVAGEAPLFTAAEMPHLIRAAARLARRKTTMLPGDLRREASIASHRAGTRPADVAKPARKPVSKTALEAYWKRGGSLVDHVRHGCRKVRCSVCG